MFQTRRWKAEGPYFSKNSDARAPARTPARQFLVPRARKVKIRENRLFWSPEISGARAPKCARANFFEKFNVSAFQRRVSRVLTTSSYFFKRI